MALNGRVKLDKIHGMVQGSNGMTGVSGYFTSICRGSVNRVKLPAHRAGLPGNVVMITGSALLPAPA